MEGIQRSLSLLPGLLLVVLMSLVLESLSKSVAHLKDGHLFPKSFSCHCEVTVNTSTRGTLSYDFGEIKAFDDPYMSCRDVRHRCREACQERAALDKYVTDSHENNHNKLGYTLCLQYSTPTQDGPLDVVVQSVVPQCPGRKPIKEKHENLCCGLIPVPLSNTKTVEALGWDKACNAVTYVV